MTDSLTGSPTWIQEMLAHLKTYFKKGLPLAKIPEESKGFDFLVASNWLNGLKYWKRHGPKMKSKKTWG